MKAVCAIPGVIERRSEKELIACLPLPEWYGIDTDKLMYNDFTSADYWYKVFGGKMPSDSIYQVLELYSAGIRAKQLKQKIKAGKIRRDKNEPPNSFASLAERSDPSEQCVCVPFGGHIKEEPRVVCIQ